MNSNSNSQATKQASSTEESRDTGIQTDAHCADSKKEVRTGGENVQKPGEMYTGKAAAAKSKASPISIIKQPVYAVSTARGT